jgi:hypothetical protein
MNAREEAIFEKKAEAMLAGHRQAPNGRNVFAFKMRYLDNDTYKSRFDRTFPGAPGSQEWFDRKFGCK